MAINSQAKDRWSQFYCFFFCLRKVPLILKGNKYVRCVPLGYPLARNITTQKEVHEFNYPTKMKTMHQMTVDRVSPTVRSAGRYKFLQVILNAFKTDSWANV